MAEWYYAVDGQQHGPASEDDLRQKLQSGELGGQDLVWREGMGNWTAAAQLPEFSAAIAAPPVAPAPLPAPLPEGFAPQPYGAAPQPYGAAPQPSGATQLSYGGYQAYATPGNIAGYNPNVYAGFWIRVGAYIIDMLICYAVSYGAGLVLGLIIGVLASGNNGAGDIAGAVGGIVGIIIQWLYFAMMESSAKQATLGKMACGLIVVDEVGQRLGFGRATGRYFAKIISALICYIGFIMVGTDARKRGLHDQIAKTFVLKQAMLTPQ